MKNRQGLTIAALIIAIVGLSIGFAAFSNTLTISSSANVNPSNTMRVVFSKSATTEVTGSANSVLPNSNTYGDGATIDNSESFNSKLTDLHAKFTAPGQSVTYNTDLYVTNVGSYKAQLTGIQFQNAENATGSETYKHCYAATKDSNNQDIPVANQATPSLVTQACNGISIKVTIGTAQNVTPASTGALAALNHQIINVGASLPVSITISYDDGASYVDGPMEIEFGDIVISATSAVDETAVVVPSEPPTPDYSSMFVGLEPGILSEYIGTDTDVVIPDNLTLPVQIATPNQQKCEANFPEEMLEDPELEGETVESVCQTLPDDLLVEDIIEFGYEFAYDITTQDILITTIGPSAFQNKNLTSVSIGNSITTIGYNSFSGNSLTSVTIPSSVTTIGWGAFRDNPLTEVIIGSAQNRSNIELIGNSAFVTLNDRGDEPEAVDAAEPYTLLQNVEIYANQSEVELGLRVFGSYSIANSWK